MQKRTVRVLAGALAVAALSAPSLAHGATPGRPAQVTVRVEGPTRTLASATVTTSRRAVIKDGNPAHSCTGTSAAGALEQATGGNWSGTWFDGLGYAIDEIAGVRAPADFSAYWMLWVNGRPSMTGICDTELQAGDEVLTFLCRSNADFSGCTNLPLALRAVRVRGAVATVEVVRLIGDGTSKPAVGATVSGGEHPVRTGADGRARVTLVTAQSALRATREGDVPSALLHCRLGKRGASCGSRDRTPPTVTVRGITDGRAFTVNRAPRLLRGTAADAGGVTVALRLIRRHDGRCAVYNERRETFTPCGRRLRPPFKVGDRQRWSFLLPRRLGVGAYRLDVRATDGAGNARTVSVRFKVKR